MLCWMHPASRRLRRALAAGAAALIAVTGLAVGGEGTAAAPVAAASVSPSAATSTPFCAPAKPGYRTCLGLALKPAFRRQTPARAGSRAQAVENPAGGYAPQDIQSAYGLTGAVSTNGSGQTVAVVDAYDDPNAAADLATYRTYFGLPACTVVSGCFTKVDLSSGTTDPTGGWELETSLDIEAVSTACPLCHILLVEANDAIDASLIAAIQKASSLGASDISLSFGGCEGGGGDFDTTLQQANVPITVATGDNGYFSADNPGCAAGTPEYPASSPYVTAVGGTRLTTAANARGWSEAAWGFATGNGAGGSGCSSFEPKPRWQTDTGCSNRTAADISADADPSTGVSIYDSFTGGGGWGEVGGTSVGAPLLAGIYALASSPTAAVGGQIWYLTARVNDVTSGGDAVSPSDCSSRYLCNAEVGYDGPTGMGTPNGPPVIQPTVTQLTTPWSSTAIPLSWSPPPNIQPSRYQIWERDDTTGTGWVPWISTTATSINFNGFRSHTYGFAVQYFMANGSSNGPPSTAATATTIAANAPLAMLYTGMYAVDGFGALHPASSPPLVSTASWPGWNIARGLVASPSGEGGLILDGWGNLHPFGDSLLATATSYWPGWDIARGITAIPAPSVSTYWTGYVLDGFGGLHPFSAGVGPAAPAPTLTGYWRGWDIARGVATFSNGSGGVVLDGWGGVHPFAAGSNPVPVGATVTGYWPGWDIARSVVLLAGSTAASYQGYVLDGWGGLHPFASAGAAMPPPVPNQNFYWPGWDIARSVVMVPGSVTAGYVIDGYGGFHTFGSALMPFTPNYGVNAPLVRSAAVG
jgi:hypothetical protein